MANDFFDVQIESDYGYRFNQLIDRMQANVLNMQAYFGAGIQNGAIIKEDLNLIAKEMENTAKKFAQEQGLGGGTSLVHFGSAITNKFGTVIGHNTGSVAAKGPTGNLIRHIVGKVDNNHVILKNEAKNDRNQYYAGHIEYGFHDRSGKMVPARPFMRPALYAVADASKGQITGTLARYLEQIWAMETLQFGSLNISRGRTREFYKLAMNPQAKGYGTYTSSRLSQGRFSDLRQRDTRMRQTVDRSMSNKYSRQVGSRMGYASGSIDTRGKEHLSDTRWYKGESSVQKISSTSSRTQATTSVKSTVTRTVSTKNKVGYQRQSLANGGYLGQMSRSGGSRAAHGEGIKAADGTRYGRYKK